MATIAIAFCAAGEAGLPVASAYPRAVQSITSSGTSQQATITAGNGEICRITASGGKIWIKFGANPTAAAGSDYLIPDGATHEFGIVAAGHKIAVIDG